MPGAMTQVLQERGYKIVSGGTDNHSSCST